MSTVCMHAERDGIANPLMMGFSPESETIQGLIFAAISHLRASYTIGRPLTDTWDELKTVYTTCSEVNWDGNEALPVTVDACLEAASFLEQLPSSVSMPHIVGGTDGDVILEWRKHNRRLFAISMYGNNQLVYAGLFGPNSKRGTIYFGNSIPAEIISSIQKIK